ncbi:hypothetical protein TUN199_00565 [Pyrenophora tritici-repentis]|nr:hypothetical protein Alg130_00363 [Pyrenophora tritici-repentis]KAI0615441.1 hypothetical protein TUN205_00366 [Pyrenophora tritici-repentis]KAI0627498.1 hypothetical protein TUN199_00565 [Pyrenophora tritici-repentis]
MNHIRATRSLWSRRAIPTRVRVHHLSRTYAAEAASPHPPSLPPNPNSSSPPPPPKEPSRVGAYYGTFGSPILKCFLGALFTYQLAYYVWYKLETIEETHDTEAEIRDLQEELRQAIEKQRYMAQQKWGQATEAMEREREELEQAIDAVVGEVREGVDGVGKGTRVASRVARGGWWPW